MSQGGGGGGVCHRKSDSVQLLLQMCQSELSYLIVESCNQQIKKKKKSFYFAICNQGAWNPTWT